MSFHFGVTVEIPYAGRVIILMVLQIHNTIVLQSAIAA
jgi:hypothetical protein